MKLELSKNILEHESHWRKPIDNDILESFSAKDLALFDQNGYKMTDMEQLYCDKNFPGKANTYLSLIHI